MQITDFHATYYSYLLTRQASGDSVEMLAATLQDSRVDLNPHQINGALFALRSPFGRGIIEADEVGLGKTIVAGIVLAQKWAESKRRMLIIVPANLRRQWQVELLEKFYLPSVIMDGDTFKESLKVQKNPFFQNDIIITSYNFAHAKAEYVKEIDWDIAVIDEAHKLRNAYKPDNIIARSIRDSLKDCFKLLLTATPLQNSLLELYGLISFIDDYTFGDLDSFKAQFLFIKDEQQNAFSDLVARLHTVCIRTLRRQVLEYIKYTERLPITQEFTPAEAEQELCDKFSKYLQRDNLWALPNSGRQLITLILWKLLSSSTFAVAGTLETFITRLSRMLESGYNSVSLKVKFYDDVSVSDYEDVDAPVKIRRKKLTEKDKISLKAEIEELKGYFELANSITVNAKGEALIVALRKGFEKLKQLKAPQKAVIFTESRRTQEYIYRTLQNSRYKDKSVLYFGGMKQKDQEGTKDRFRNDMQIMIATESAAEGLNLQYCPMVINYDLPFNPQRIEQRIGRCHRYGQQNDVVVINFLNKNNIADQRVYELLCDKFQLFEGVFGASDGILGSIDALDFEKRIVEIYQKCRTATEIEKSFAQLRESLTPQIDAQLQGIKQKLLENFDEDVTKRLKINYDDSESYLNKFETMLWAIAKHKLDGKYATFDDDNKKFKITATWKKNPYYNSRYGYKRLWGEYELNKNAPLDKRYRLKCSLAQTLIHDCMGSWQFGGVCFDLTGYKGKFSNLERLKGKGGYLTLNNMEIIYPTRRENRLVFAGYCDDGTVLSEKQMKRMFDLEGERREDNGQRTKDNVGDRLQQLLDAERERIIEEISVQNSNYFEEETAKLDKWSRDVKIGLERTLRDLDKSIEEVNIQLRGRQLSLKRRLELQEQLSMLEPKRKELRMKIYDDQDKIDEQRKKLIEETKKKLTQKVDCKHIFTIRWAIK